MKKHKWIWIAVVIVVIAAVFLFNSPKFRAKLFVGLYAETIENGMAAGNGVPADDAILFGYRSVNTWEGEHAMTEFILLTRGDTYYGVYYSPDDVPVAFQNVPAELTQDGHDYWVWKAEGDNHGTTSKIQDHWYYFEASF